MARVRFGLRLQKGSLASPSLQDPCLWAQAEVANVLTKACLQPEKSKCCSHAWFTRSQRKTFICIHILVHRCLTKQYNVHLICRHQSLKVHYACVHVFITSYINSYNTIHVDNFYDAFILLLYIWNHLNLYKNFSLWWMIFESNGWGDD